MLRVSAYSSRQLQAVIVALKHTDRDTRKQIRTQTKTIIDPIWRKTVAEHATTRLEQRVLAQTARVAVSDQNVTLKSAVVGKRLLGGLNPKTDYAAVEFGAERGHYRQYEARSRKGRSFTVKRRTTMQLRDRKRTGHVVYPAASEVIPRLLALWAQTVARSLHEALESR